MMTWTEKTPNITQNPLLDDVEQTETTVDAAIATESLASIQRDLSENSQSLAEELLALRRDHARLQQAIFEAAQIQRRLCAPRELSWREFEVAGEIFPVRHLSGDFFKVMQLRSALRLAVGDIAGKGLSAGIWQAHVMGLIERAARNHPSPAEAVAEVNRELCLSGEPPLTALFFARIDLQSNALVYCNAGLPAPLLLRDNKTLERLEKGGPMLGAVQNARFDSGRLTLNPGDMLLAYSDGVTECRNARDEEFEIERLVAAAKAVTGMPASRALFSLLGAVLDFADTCSPGDDLTLLVVRRREATLRTQTRSRVKDFPFPNRRPASVKRPKNVNRTG